MRLAGTGAVNALSYSLLVFTVRQSPSGIATGLLLMLSVLLPSALLGAMAGVLVDRLPRGLILFASQLCRAGLVFLLVAVLFALYVAAAVITPVEELMRVAHADARSAIDQLAQAGRPVVSWALGSGDGQWVDFLLLERPALLSAIFLILLFGLPFLIPLGAFNQTAGEIGSRVIEWVDHLHEHFLDPAVVERGRYLAPAEPGFSAQLKDETLSDYRYPDSPVWTALEGEDD